MITPQARGSYAKRDNKIRLLGLGSNYREYLASDLWKSIRKRVMERDKGTCRICFEAASQVHHSAYTKAGLTGTAITGLYAVCRGCHEFIEFEQNGDKVGIGRVKQRVRLLARIKGTKFSHPGSEKLSAAERLPRKYCKNCRRSKTFKMFLEGDSICKKCRTFPASGK
jgi:hypothetical protein